MAGKAYRQLLEGARYFQGNSLKINRNKEIKPQGGKQKEKEESEWGQCRGKQLFPWPRRETTYSDNNETLIVPIKATAKNVCTAHNESTDPEKESFQLKIPTVKDYVKFQFTCPDGDPATLAVGHPDLGLVSPTSSSLFARGRMMANSLKTVLQGNHTEEFPARKGIF